MRRIELLVVTAVVAGLVLHRLQATIRAVRATKRNRTQNLVIGACALPCAFAEWRSVASYFVAQLGGHRLPASGCFRGRRPT